MTRTHEAGTTSRDGQAILMPSTSAWPPRLPSSLPRHSGSFTRTTVSSPLLRGAIADNRRTSHAGSSSLPFPSKRRSPAYNRRHARLVLRNSNFQKFQENRCWNVVDSSPPPRCARSSETAGPPLGANQTGPLSQRFTFKTARRPEDPAYLLQAPAGAPSPPPPPPPRVSPPSPPSSTARSPEKKSGGAETPPSVAETTFKNETAAGRPVGERSIPRTAASAPPDTNDRQACAQYVNHQGRRVGGTKNSAWFGWCGGDMGQDFRRLRAKGGACVCVAGSGVGGGGSHDSHPACVCLGPRTQFPRPIRNTPLLI